MPGKQLQGFILFFHGVVVLAFAITLYWHWHQTRVLGRAEAALVLLVLLQIFLYACFVVFPGCVGWVGGRWLRDLLRNAADSGWNKRLPDSRWWWVLFLASITVVILECRIDPGFRWGLIICASHVMMLPLRTALPASAVLLAAYLFNQFGWSRLAMWDAGDWFSKLMTVTPFMALFLFFGRMAATSAERGRLILELEAAKRELELARQREGELATLRERERLARELHDSLGHSLVTLTVQLEAAQRLQSADPARAVTLLGEMQKLTRSSMEDLRRSLANLRSPGLGDRPLAETVRTLCAEAAKRMAVTVDCELGARADTLPPAVAEVFWRVAQEGLTNIEKHAQPRHVQVSLNFQPKAVLMQVSDDGVGLPADAEEKPGHYGLRGLRERVEGLGGTFTAKSSGKGSVIEASVPWIE